MWGPFLYVVIRKLTLCYRLIELLKIGTLLSDTNNHKCSIENNCCVKNTQFIWQFPKLYITLRKINAITIGDIRRIILMGGSF